MTSDADLCFAPAHFLASLIAHGELSAYDLVEAVVSRAQAVQSKLNCIAVPLYEEALAAAKRADMEAARGENLGPLHGIPITVKDGLATAGHLQTFGSLSCADSVAMVDDIVWRRLKEAGAILIGKTTTPEFFHKVTTDSLLFGITRNPWSLAHTPGGSSGGAAAALAAGVGPLAVGSDGGGSLRCPAACTGTLALKPTVGRVPHVRFPDTFGNYAAIGPMARDVRDLGTMLSVMSGTARDDATSLRVRHFGHDGGPNPLRSVTRVGWIADPGSYGVRSDMARSALSALDILADVGIRVETLDGSLLDGAFDTYRVIASVGHASRARTQDESAQALWSESFRSLVRRGLSHSASDLQAAQEKRTQLFRAVQGNFETVDIIATPTLNAPPKDVGWNGSVEGDCYAAWTAALYPFNLTGHPAISIPCGFTAEGLPIGLQLVAPWYEEARLIRLAAALESARPWIERRPFL